MSKITSKSLQEAVQTLLSDPSRPALVPALDLIAVLQDLLQCRADLEAVGAGGVGPLMPAAKSQEIPDGWKLVPEEPNCSMVLAGERSLEQHDFLRLDSAYRAMLAAAPQPPDQDGWQKLDKPARVGGGTFGIGTSAQHVVLAAQRAHDEHVRSGKLTHEQLVEEERKRRALWDMINGSPEAPKSPFVWQAQGEQKPVSWIENFQGSVSYGPIHEAARKLPVGVRFDLYTHPQNLHCKSTQARLATLWGYVKADQQPHVAQEPDWQGLYRKEKRRAEMWIAKYEKDIGKLQLAVPVAAQPPSVAARTCANCLHNKPPFGNCDGCSQQNDDADDEGNWEPIPEPQGEQEPRAWCALNADRSGIAYFDGRPIIMTGPIGNEHHPDPLYTHPQPQRKPLTDEEIDTLEWSVPQPGEDGAYLAQRRNVRAVERAHGIGGEA